MKGVGRFFDGLDRIRKPAAVATREKLTAHFKEFGRQTPVQAMFFCK